jgi:hypothetical protein
MARSPFVSVVRATGLSKERLEAVKFRQVEALPPTTSVRLAGEELRIQMFPLLSEAMAEGEARTHPDPMAVQELPERQYRVVA